MNKIYYILTLCAFLLAGCDNKDLLQSEKKIQSQLESHKWSRIQAYVDTDPAHVEIWSFSSGTATIQKDRNSDGILDSSEVNIHANYVVETKVSSSYVTLTGIPYPNSLLGLENVNMNLKWTVAEINDNVLYLSASTEAGTIKSMEFIKK